MAMKHDQKWLFSEWVQISTITIVGTKVMVFKKKDVFSLLIQSLIVIVGVTFKARRG